jgi:LysR family transcriptional regulator, low CO2-responsive transcriptional regulator
MTLRQLAVFVAVAQAQSFRRAAERLHTSQPALSQHVKELEDELDVRLLDRLRRNVHLTDAGRLVLDHAQRVFTTLGSVREVIGELKGLQRGSLLIGASTTPGIYVLPRVIGDFRKRHPNITVNFRIANSRVIEERIRANELDLGVVGGHGLVPGEECLAAGLVDELVLIVWPGHPWARRREILPADLESVPLLFREEGSATRQVTERALQGARVAYRLAMELDHTEAIKQAVMAELGVAFVSLYTIRGELATRSLHAIRLRGVPIHRHFHVIHNEARALSASAQAFLRTLDEGGATPRRSGRRPSRVEPGDRPRRSRAPAVTRARRPCPSE